MQVKAHLEKCTVCESLPPERTERLAIPTEATRDDPEVFDRIAGALLGCAIGDGLGEMARRGLAITSCPGAGSLWVGGACQTTLFTLEGVIRMLVRLHIKGIGPGYAVLRHALDRWLFTQHPANAHAVRRRWQSGIGEGDWPDGWLVRQHALHHRRSIMATTVKALNLAKDVDFDQQRRLVGAPNTSDGAGGLVRVGPAGSLVPLGFSFELGARIAAQTHGSPDAFLSAGCLSRVVAGLIAGEPLAASVDEADRELGTWPASERTHEVLLGRGDPTLHPGTALGALSRAMRPLGDGDHGKPVEIIAAVALSGGTAAAAVCGLILGAQRGTQAFEAGWRKAPEVGDLIEELALAASLVHRKFVLGRTLPGLEINIGPDDGYYLDQVLWARYPGW